MQGWVSVHLRAANVSEREATIAEWLRATPPAATHLVLAEGMLFGSANEQGVPIVALAGCPCCVGAVALRVKLTRALRELRPDHVLILLAGEAHLPHLRQMLTNAEFGVRLEVDG